MGVFLGVHMLELRILNGLHRGATLPLDEKPQVFGASEDADVVLVDEGIEQRHATLTRTKDGWLLSAGEGQVYTADSNRPQTIVDLKAGDFARIGDIWMTIVKEGAPWENPPAEPIDVDLDDEIVDPPHESEGDTTEEDTGDTSPSTPEQNAVPDEKDDDLPPVKSPTSKRRMLVPVLLIAALCAAGVYTFSTGMPKQAAPGIADAHTKIESPSAMNTAQNSAKSEKQGTLLGQDELRALLRKRLADAELLKRFDLNLEDHNWSLRATLDAEETARFERILKAFIAKYEITFPVRATVGGGEEMLPFTIKQVISGANASVVTSEGYRLYIGDVYRGVRVAAIQDSRLTFIGKRKVEVNW